MENEKKSNAKICKCGHRMIPDFDFDMDGHLNGIGYECLECGKSEYEEIMGG